MVYTEDDDSFMQLLVSQLDINTAKINLESVGFIAMSEYPQCYAFSRSYHNITENIAIRMDSNNHFQIVHTENTSGCIFTDKICSWDEWVVFVKMLSLRATTRLVQPRVQHHKKGMSFIVSYAVYALYSIRYSVL